MVNKTFQETLSEFYYPPIPEPEIRWDYFDKRLIKVDHEKWGFMINLAATPNISQDELERFYKVISRRIIAYYVVCPYDIETSTRMLVSAVTSSNIKVGKIATNLLIELINTDYLSRIYRDDMIWFYKLIFGNLSFSMKKKIGLEIIVPLLIEKILDHPIINDNVRNSIDNKWFETSNEIYRVISRGGILSRENWPNKAAKIAEILWDTLSTSSRNKTKNLLNIASNAFLRDLSDEGILLSNMNLPYEREASDLDAIKLRIIRSAIKNPIDIVKVTPAIETFGIFKEPREIVRYWYRERARNKMRIQLSNKQRKEELANSFPSTWQVTDSAEKLDVVLSLSSFPKMIPNITTKKWVKLGIIVHKKSIKPLDLLIIIDSSGSMGYYTGWVKPKIEKKSKEYKIMKKLGINYSIGSKFDIAVTAAFAAIEYALRNGSKVAVINFSGRGIVCNWTRDRKKAENYVMIFQGNGTELPVKKIMNVLSRINRALVILITDSEIYNEKEAIQCLKTIRKKGHTLYVFHIEERKEGPFIQEVSKIGEIIHVKNINELADIVIGRVKKHYQFP